MNNAAGYDTLVEALGYKRVLTGFPMAAGYRDNYVVHVLAGSEDKKSPVPFGEIDGSITQRTLKIACVIDSMPGFKSDIQTDMDAWSKYHVALLMPSLAPALYMCNTDNVRLAKTRDAIVMAIRAIREGFAVLKKLGYPITPKSLRKFTWIPEPILVAGFRRKVADPLMKTALVNHANAARDEIKHLVDEFMVLVNSTNLPTPNIDLLYQHLDPDAPVMPEGRREISLDWYQMRVIGLFVMTLISFGISLSIWRKIKDR
jgi:2-dehydropantoate 2-reductase